jgi:protein-tyrosine phosphatase
MANRITPYIFLGSLEDAKDRRYNYIVNVSDQSYTKPYTPVITLLSNDISSFKIDKYFDVFCDMMYGMEQRRESCLVHCMQGISRSATMVAAYLIRRYGMTAVQAVEELRQKRHIVNPNPGFMKMLQKYHKKLSVASSSQRASSY